MLTSLKEEDTSLTYNIRTSLQLFENYIKKSGKLIFSVFKYPSREHVGDVTVWNPYKTIFSGKFEPGYYPIFNKNRIRIGDLRISFELYMPKRDNPETVMMSSDKIFSELADPIKNPGVTSTSALKDEYASDPLYNVVNRGKELRDAMTMSVLEDVPVENIDKVISNSNGESVPTNDKSDLIDANKLMDFLMG